MTRSLPDAIRIAERCSRAEGVPVVVIPQRDAWGQRAYVTVLADLAPTLFVGVAAVYMAGGVA